MGSGRSGGVLPALAGVVGSAVLFFFGTGLTPIAALAWLAPLPVLFLARRVSAKAAAGSAFLAFLLGSANSWVYYSNSRDVPVPAALVIVLGGALLFALAVALFRALLVRGLALPAAVALPATWTGVLYLTSLVGPNGVVGTMATTQADVPMVLQVASLTGAWGVEFLVFFLPSAVVALLSSGVATAPRVRVGIITAVVFAMVLGMGVLRLGTDGGPSQRVSLVARNQHHWGVDVATPAGQDLIRSYVDHITGLPVGVRLVVLPEGGFAADDATQRAIVEPLAEVARSRGLDIVVGVMHTSKGTKFNTALGIPAGGSAPVEYRKQHVGTAPVQSGHELVFLPGTGPRVGLQIRMDVNFPNPSRDYADAGAQLVVVPAADEDVNGWQHSRAAVLRGVENGFAVAWTAQRGTLTMSDGFGRVLAEEHTGSPAPFTSVTAEISVGNGATVYTRLGDWFAWLCLALTAACLVDLRARHRANH